MKPWIPEAEKQQMRARSSNAGLVKKGTQMQLLAAIK